MGTNNNGKLRLGYGSGASEEAAVTSAKDGSSGITIQTDGNVGRGCLSIALLTIEVEISLPLILPAMSASGTLATLALHLGGHLYPSTDNLYDIGSSSTNEIWHFKEGYWWLILLHSLWIRHNCLSMKVQSSSILNGSSLT